MGFHGAHAASDLIKQLVSDTLAAFVVAFVLAMGAFGFAKRVLVSVLRGLFAWLTISFPYWNWYRFPMEFTVANLLEQVLGWLFAGMAIAWWLGRRAR